jgi:hypothetical protein
MTESSRPETPEETWARLRAGNNTSPSQPGTTFPLRRFGAGYDVAEVDAFVQGIDRRSDAEIKRATFHVRRFGAGYDLTAVDDYLEDVLKRRQRGR